MPSRQFLSCQVSTLAWSYWDRAGVTALSRMRLLSQTYWIEICIYYYYHYYYYFHWSLKSTICFLVLIADKII